MLLRVVGIYLLMAVFIPCVSSADDLLDYKNIGPLQIVERIARTLVEGSGAERRFVTDEAHELGEKYLSALGEDEDTVEFFATAGEAFIPLFWTSKSTTRVRCERILAEFINDLAPYAASPDDTKRALAIKLLERYAALMMVAPGNASSGKLLEEIRQAFEKVEHEFTVTPATAFTALEGLPNPDPMFGKNEGEKTVAVAQGQKPAVTPEPAVAPEPAPAEVVAVQVAPKAVSKAPVAAASAEKVRVVSAAGNKPSARQVSARRVSAKPPGPTGGGTTTVRVSANKITGVTGAIGAGVSSTKVVSVKASSSARASGSRGVARVSARPLEASPRSGSPAALRILNEQLQSDDEAELLAAFGLARKLYEQIKHSAKAGVGAERDTAQNIIVRSRMLVGSPKLSVKKAAIPMVAELGDYRSVGQLIRLLSEKRGGINELALAALRKLTGEDYGYSVDKWLAWHASK